MKITPQEAYLRLQDGIQKLKNPTPCAEPGLDYLFFPEPIWQEGIGRYSEAVRNDMRLHELQAKALCSLCPIRDLCAEYAIIAKEEHGIFGGITPNERREIQGLKKTKSNHLF